MLQLEHIEAIEKRLWEAADTLRANSNYASNEYFLPVMGLVFLRHAFSRYLAVKDESRGRPPYPRRQETRDNEAGLLPQERHLPAPGGSVRSPRRPARRRGPGQGHHRGHGVHRGGLRQPARRPAQVGVPGVGQRRARPAPALAQPRRAEADLGRRLRPHLRVLPHPVRRPEGARRRRVLHPLLPGLADRPRARPRPRHGARPGVRLRRDVRAERAHGGGARPQPRRSAHLPGPGEERHHHPLSPR